VNAEVWFPLFGAGLCAGFIDAVAGGGGMISVPALLWAGLPPHLALGTNKLQSSVGTLIAVWHYLRSGWVEGRELGRVVGVTFACAVAGTLCLTRVDNEFLGRVIPWLLLVVATHALFSPRFGEENREPKVGAGPFAWMTGTTLGFYDGFFGPGTGAFWTMAWISLRGKSLAGATAATKVVNLASNLAALCVFLPAGLARYDLAGAMIGGQLLGARLGAGLAVRHGALFIRRIFLGAVFAMVLKMLWEQWGS
jgi:uncharacterized membrane protein YfcA